MARFWKTMHSDWCHICGTRQDTNVVVSFPNNAEHEVLGDCEEISGCCKRGFIRICADCGETVCRIGRGEFKDAVRNNPVLVTAQIKGFSPDIKPDAN